jgi:hypothetical protein
MVGVFIKSSTTLKFIRETPILMKRRYYPVTGCRVFENSFPLLTEVLHKRSGVISASCNESQVSETKLLLLWQMADEIILKIV